MTSSLRRFQHRTHFDNAFALEPATTFKTMNLSHIEEQQSNNICLEYNFTKKEDLEKLYCQYIYCTLQLTLQHNTTTTSLQENHKSQTKNLSDIFGASANTKLDIQLNAATADEMKLLAWWCIFDANVSVSKHGHHFNIKYNPSIMKMTS